MEGHSDQLGFLCIAFFQVLMQCNEVEGGWVWKMGQRSYFEQVKKTFATTTKRNYIIALGQLV
jgi:hypothetical protein